MYVMPMTDGKEYHAWRKCLKDNLPHNTYQIHVKHHPKNTEMTLEYQIFDEKALE